MRRVVVVTGTRAEFGLLRPVMRAIGAQKGLELCVVAAGAHFLRPARTIREVEAEFDVAARVRMQRDGVTGRLADAAALGRGVEGFARAFAKLRPDWVVVLGDRIEALAAASAASVGGIAVAHIHGGDRAEGIADEAMRHAITKLAHLHLAATKKSAKRIVQMGERSEHVYVTGSPAVDGLDKVKPMSAREAGRLGNPSILFLLHPVGRGDEFEYHEAWARLFGVWTYAWDKLFNSGRQPRILALDPNFDPGRAGTMRALEEFGRHWGIRRRSHLPRPAFLSLLARLAKLRGGVVVGNSSAGLIEAARLGLPVVDIGPRQDGRERDRNVVGVPADGVALLAINRAVRLHGRLRPSRLFGDGRAGMRIAEILANTDPRDPRLLRKQNAY